MEKEKSDNQIDYHLKKIKAIKHSEFDAKKGRLMADIFLRNTGGYISKDNHAVIKLDDLYAWFENLDYLKEYTEYDKL